MSWLNIITPSALATYTLIIAIACAIIAYLNYGLPYSIPFAGSAIALGIGIVRRIQQKKKA